MLPVSIRPAARWILFTERASLAVFRPYAKLG